MIHDLFPTPIGKYTLDRALTDKELSFLKNQKTRSNIGNTRSINSLILKAKELTKLRNFIETKVSEYFIKVYRPKHKVNLKITQSWTNYTNQGQYHHRHAHPNSFVSGVFYVQSNLETDKIYFHNDAYKQINVPPEEWNVWNSESWWFDVGTNDLILFPSSLTHSVEAVKHEETRISLSFNTFPVGQIGDEIGLTSLQFGDLLEAFK